MHVTGSRPVFRANIVSSSSGTRRCEHAATGRIGERIKFADESPFFRLFRKRHEAVLLADVSLFLYFHGNVDDRMLELASFTDSAYIMGCEDDPGILFSVSFLLDFRLVL